MEHQVYRVGGVTVAGPSAIRVTFDDGVERTVELSGMLRGPLFGPLRDAALFAQVRVDPEVHTVVWPNGADFDPATLHDWEQHRDSMEALAHSWELAPLER
jgi:hypothetical protein